MEFCRLVSSRDILFTESFSLYEISFPKHEQRPGDQQALLLSNPLYHFDAIADQGALAGILLYWEGSGYVYIEHFAIHPSRRGQAVGSKSLELFCRKHSRVVLEIDPPVDPVSIRRKGFYQRLGFQANAFSHKHPAYRKEFPPHELVVMSYPDLMTEEEYQTFHRELGEVFMGDMAC